MKINIYDKDYTTHTHTHKETGSWYINMIVFRFAQVVFPIKTSYITMSWVQGLKSNVLFHMHCHMVVLIVFFS